MQTMEEAPPRKRGKRPAAPIEAPAPKVMGRPPVDVNWGVVDLLCGQELPLHVIACALAKADGVLFPTREDERRYSERITSSLNRRYAPEGMTFTAYRKKILEERVGTLRSVLWEEGLDKRNTTILKLLAGHYAGMSEKVTQTHESSVPVIVNLAAVKEAIAADPFADAQPVESEIEDADDRQQRHMDSDTANGAGPERRNAGDNEAFKGLEDPGVDDPFESS